MKINFDELFSRTMHLSTIPNTFTREEPTNNKTHQFAKEERSVTGTSKGSYLKSSEMRIEQKQENSYSILEKLNKLTKMIEDKQQTTKKPKVNIAELTNKLYQPKPTSKKTCTKNSKIIKQEPKLNPNDRKQGLKSHHKSSAQIGFPRYVRLYNLSKINSIKNLYRTQSHKAEFDRQHVKQQHRTKISQSYLEKYVPFYDRLESEVNKSFQKQKFYENNPQLACGQLKQLFKPTTIPDRYKDKIECRYNRSTRSTRNTNELQQALNSSLNTSFCSLDKSVEIINKVEDHFFNKMKLIFLNQSEQYVTISEHIINMLSEVEFKILHNFIIDSEENPIHHEDFQNRLKDYYYNLLPNQRLQLRNHQTKKKPKTSQQFSQRDQPSIKSFKKAQQKPSKYLKKVESFV